MGQSSSRPRPSFSTNSPNIPPSGSEVHTSSDSRDTKAKRRRSLVNIIKRRGSSRRNTIASTTSGTQRRSWRQSRRWSKLALGRTDSSQSFSQQTQPSSSNPVTKDAQLPIEPQVDLTDTAGSSSQNIDQRPNSPVIDSTAIPIPETDEQNETTQVLPEPACSEIPLPEPVSEESIPELYAEAMPETVMPLVPPTVALHQDPPSISLPPPPSPPPPPPPPSAPRTFPPPGTLVVVQGVVHTTDMPRPQNLSASNNATNSAGFAIDPSSSSSGADSSRPTSRLSSELQESLTGTSQVGATSSLRNSSSASALTRTRSESRARQRLSALFSARPSSSAGSVAGRRLSSASTSAGTIADNRLSRRASTIVHPVEPNTTASTNCPSSSEPVQSSASMSMPTPTSSSTSSSDENNDTRISGSDSDVITASNRSTTSTTATVVTAATSPESNTPAVASTPVPTSDSASPSSPPAPSSSISSNSIDVLGTLLSVAAAATAASLLTGPSEHLMPHSGPNATSNNNNNNNDASSPNTPTPNDPLSSLPSSTFPSPPSSPSMPSSLLSSSPPFSRPSLPTGPGDSINPSGQGTHTNSNSERMRHAWGSIRERLGLRHGPSGPGSGSGVVDGSSNNNTVVAGGAVPSLGTSNNVGGRPRTGSMGPGAGGGAGGGGGVGMGMGLGAENRPPTSSFPMDARERMLAEMARAFNLGLGMPVAEHGQGQGQGQGRESGNGGSETQDSGQDGVDVGERRNGGTVQREGSGGAATTSLPLPAEGSFERFLVDLQTDLRTALLGGAGESVGFGGRRVQVGQGRGQQQGEQREREQQHEEHDQQQHAAASLSTDSSPSSSLANTGASSGSDPVSTTDDHSLSSTAMTSTNVVADVPVPATEAREVEESASTTSDDSMPPLHDVSDSDDSELDEDEDDDDDSSVEDDDDDEDEAPASAHDVMAQLLTTLASGTGGNSSNNTLTSPSPTTTSRQAEPTSTSVSASSPAPSPPARSLGGPTGNANNSPGRINWWRLYRFPPIAAPRAHAAAESVAANMTSSLAPLNPTNPPPPRVGTAADSLLTPTTDQSTATMSESTNESGSMSVSMDHPSPSSSSLSSPSTMSGFASSETSPSSSAPSPPSPTSPATTATTTTTTTSTTSTNLVVPVIVVGLQSVNLPLGRHGNFGMGMDAGGNANQHDENNEGSDQHEHEHEHEDLDQDTFNEELAELERDLRLSSAPAPSTDGNVNTGSRGRRWHSRAANALRSLRGGSRQQDGQGVNSNDNGGTGAGIETGVGAGHGAVRGPLLDLDGPGSRTFLIYVIGGYYPPDHSIVTGEPENLDSFEALLDLAELLGQVKPPTVSKEEIERSGLEVIKATQLEEYETNGKISSNCTERCLICLDDYEPEDDLRVLSCKHGFHMGCVDKWLQEGKNNCPACRTRGVSDDVASPPPTTTTA
ncbi:hypothetical protein K435DRAFT_863395 [Dendrothele bispora CBS 962.96]|uniref:RING-type domain-containing protein n=1 Tax=Dendrothele bispora (strain CBS 962.96) TaxID=1314807 RepID=A0A4S8LQ36_DENBC|nr:hypothetical protein K435DRAFT_863395 [Dendrothele bispora CBS 962.96]